MRNIEDRKINLNSAHLQKLIILLDQDARNISKYLSGEIHQSYRLLLEDERKILETILRILREL